MNAGPVLAVVMGVCGTGKTVVGEALAARLAVPFLEGDRFHSRANVEKMRAGEALTDRDRKPWLDTLASELRAHAGSGPGAVLACSALKRCYRDRLRTAGPIALVHLRGPRELIVGRMQSRIGHYMPTSLLDSQLAILEPPSEDECALGIDIDRPPGDLVDRILRWLRSRPTGWKSGASGADG